MNPSVLDLGTGSGAIAIALAFNQPIWQITATDISHQALNVAKHNAQKYKLNNIQFYQGSWFSALPSHAEAKFDVIVSNPPYIAPDSVYLSLGDVLFEPLQALVANNQGLADLQHIISHAKNYLNEQGFLVVEHGYDQQEAVKTMFIDAGFSNIATLKDFQSHPRVTYGLFGETDLLK